MEEALFKNAVHKAAVSSECNDAQSALLAAAADQFVIAVRIFTEAAVRAGLFVDEYLDVMRAARDLVHQDGDDDADDNDGDDPAVVAAVADWLDEQESE